MWELTKSALKKSLAQPLPGEEAHVNMQPAARKELTKLMKAKHPKANLGGVALLIYPWNNEPHLCFMRRPEYDGAHGGQISFPGGKKELGDKDLVETALRELEEEVGVSQKEVEIIGKLSKLYIPPSNFEVHPVVATLDARPEFIPDPREVAEILEVPLSHLSNPKNQGVDNFVNKKGIGVQAPFYKFNGHKIWGATAMILSEFLMVNTN